MSKEQVTVAEAKRIRSSNGEEILRYYTPEKWKDSIDRARLYAVKKGYENPLEFVHDAISKLVSGERSWSPEYPLAQQLIHIVRSDYSHFKAKKNKHVSLEDSESLPEKLVFTNTPEQVCSTDQEIDSARNAINENGSELDKKYIKELEKGADPKKNSELASSIGVDPADIVNTKKRVRRILEKRGGA